MPILSINPSTGKTLRHFDALTSEQLEAKLALAATAWKAYQEVPLEHRALCMRKLASLIEDETEELARLMTLKTKYDSNNLFRMNQNIVPAPLADVST